jgi:5-formyltetrahydrofolate cyclo-ligase
MKKTIRREVLKKRDELSPDVRTGKDSRIKERLFSLPEFLGAKTVLFYSSFRSEVETRTLIEESLKMGRRIVLPKVDRTKHMLVLYEIKDTSELTEGYMGIHEPYSLDERMVSLEDIDLAVIPGAGFDRLGNRLGYGAGYYDILLSNSKKKMPVIALSYEEQIVDLIPAEAHDVKVDVIITEERVMRIS